MTHCNCSSYTHSLPLSLTQSLIVLSPSLPLSPLIVGLKKTERILIDKEIVFFGKSQRIKKVGTVVSRHD